MRAGPVSGSGVAARLLDRLRRSLRPPSRRGWAETLLAFIVYGALVAYPAQAAGLLELGAPGSFTGPMAGWAAWTPLRVLIVPGLLEELAFRVLPNPHRDEPASRRRVSGAAVLSLLAYVLAHPLAGLVRPGAREVMLDPVFLAATGVLGALCWGLYRRSGSLFPPVALHAAVVTVWLANGGTNALNSPA